MGEPSLLEQIAKLRGSINSYKAEPKEITSNAPLPANPSRGRGGYRGSYRGSYRGRGRGGWTGPVRNKTLIINHDNPDSEFITTVSSNGYKLINRKIYEKELKEEVLTKEQKAAALQNAKEKILRKKLELRVSKNRVRLDISDRTLIDGDLYAISRYGARLVPLNILSPNVKKEVQWNGFNYSRTKGGSLKLKGEKVFLKEQCRYFQKTGECKQGDQCKYTHNKQKVSVCRKYVKGQCLDQNCKLLHELNEFNTPICHFFANSACRNPDCSFLHVHPELELICRPFAIGNYCFRGKNCKFIHSFECPDYQLTRQCARGKGCRLTHSEKDNLDARLTFSSLDPEYYQLPDLTKLENISSDPRILYAEIAEGEEQFSDDDDDDDDIDAEYILKHPELQQLEVSADFVQF